MSEGSKPNFRLDLRDFSFTMKDHNHDTYDLRRPLS